ncbi:secretion/DNA translocation related CpaE-like protein [Corynebacterium hesseae]
MVGALAHASGMSTFHLVIAVGDSTLRAEAASAAAASTAEVSTVEDPRDFSRHLPKADAVLADSLTARLVAGHPRVYFLALDPGPIDYEAALCCRATAAFIVPAQSKELLGALAADATPETTVSTGLTLAVTGSAGGLGASTVAVALAREAGADLLVDASPYSGGLDLLTGIENKPGARWPDLAAGTGSVDAADLVRALPATSDGIAVLSAARSASAEVVQMSAARRAAIMQAACLYPGTVVVDCPPWDIPDAADHVVVLTAAEVRAAAACAQLVAELRARPQECSVVVRNRQWAGLDASDIATVTHADPIAELPTIRGLTRTVETSGLPRQLPRALARVARQMWEVVA